MTRNLQLVSVAIGLAVASATPQSSLAQSARRGAPGSNVPMTDVSITVGTATTTGRVDAKCGTDARATATNGRFFYVLMYPWFGQRVAADKPQWRFNLSVRRGATTDSSSQFTFSFLDGDREALIQTVAGSERYGSGTVRVERQGEGARFEVRGRTAKGAPVRATITCSAFQRSEAAGG